MEGLQTYVGPRRIRGRYRALRAFRENMDSRHCPLQQVSTNKGPGRWQGHIHEPP